MSKTQTTAMADGRGRHLQSAGATGSFSETSGPRSVQIGSERPKVLIPFSKREALTVGEAARLTGRTTETMRA